MVIIGIDPGYAIVGYGVVRHQGNRFTVLGYGCIRTEAKKPFETRLLNIEEGLRQIIDEFKPNCAAVEELFFNTNTKTALDVAQGRGVILLTAVKCGLQVAGYTPLQVKTAVTGYGRADKGQVQQMVKTVLNLPEIPKPDDVADALAIAICHAHSYKMDSPELSIRQGL